MIADCEEYRVTEQDQTPEEERFTQSHKDYAYVLWVAHVPVQTLND
jgi:hypothetical protein